MFNELKGIVEPISNKIQMDMKETVEWTANTLLEVMKAEITKRNRSATRQKFGRSEKLNWNP